MDKEDIEEAIEVLEDASADMLMETGDENYYVEAIAILRQALVDADDTLRKRVDEMVKTEHEPVAFINVEKQKLEWAKLTSWHTPTIVNLPKIPLYTAPPKKEWVGLTDDEIDDLSYLSQKIDQSNETWFDRWGFARAIEAKLKEKNHG